MDKGTIVLGAVVLLLAGIITSAYFVLKPMLAPTEQVVTNLSANEIEQMPSDETEVRNTDDQLPSGTVDANLDMFGEESLGIDIDELTDEQRAMILSGELTLDELENGSEAIEGNTVGSIDVGIEPLERNPVESDSGETTSTWGEMVMPSAEPSELFGDLETGGWGAIDTIPVDEVQFGDPDVEIGTSETKIEVPAGAGEEVPILAEVKETPQPDEEEKSTVNAPDTSDRMWDDMFIIALILLTLGVLSWFTRYRRNGENHNEQ